MFERPPSPESPLKRLLGNRLSRRSFLDFLGDTVLFGAAAGLIYTTARFFLPGLREGEVTNAEVPRPASAIADNSGLLFAFGRRPALLVRDEAGEFHAFLATCTHLACTVNYDPDSRRIVCPCHQGLFDLEGNVLGGPPPRPLERLSVEVEKNTIHAFRI